MDELKKYGDNIVINDYEISVLSKCNINVTKCKTIAEILLLIDRYLDDADLEDEEYEENEALYGHFAPLHSVCTERTDCPSPEDR